MRSPAPSEEIMSPKRQHTYCFRVLITLIALTFAVVCHADFSQQSGALDADSYHQQRGAVSDCQVICDQDMSCKGFDYYYPSQECYLFSTGLESSDLYPADGWDHYERVESRPDYREMAPAPTENCTVILGVKFC
jgi:hypothetical protein